MLKLILPFAAKKLRVWLQKCIFCIFEAIPSNQQEVKFTASCGRVFDGFEKVLR